jgi:hypothetical protein
MNERMTVGAGEACAQGAGQVAPYTVAGYNDAQGNYIPGFYDEAGEFHLGYGFYDEAGVWCVTYGYYTPAGVWVETEAPGAAAVQDVVAAVEEDEDDAALVVGVTRRAVDLASAPYVILSAVVHLAFLVLALTMPEDVGALEMDGLQADDRFVALVVAPQQEEPLAALDWMPSAEPVEAPASSKHKGDEGKAGKQDTPDTNSRMAIKGPSDNTDIQVKKAYDTSVAMNAGVFANGNQVASLSRTADESIGPDAVHALTALSGEEVGPSGGADGLGVRNTGRSGAGDEQGVGRSERVKTRGKEQGYGDREREEIVREERRTREPEAVLRKPVVEGSLSREQIERVAQQRRGEIKFCYEQGLQKNPKLAGTIKIKFTIVGTGAVMSALVVESSMKSPEVERCVAGKIQRWVFPEPKGNGIVVVNYPFHFSM